MAEKIKTCNGCKNVFVRKTGGMFNQGFQRICSRGVRNPRTGYAKNIGGKRNIRCEFFKTGEKNG